jgi:hypothetical protein
MTLVSFGYFRFPRVIGPCGHDLALNCEMGHRVPVALPMNPSGNGEPSVNYRNDEARIGPTWREICEIAGVVGVHVVINRARPRCGVEGMRMNNPDGEWVSLRCERGPQRIRLGDSDVRYRLIQVSISLRLKRRKGEDQPLRGHAPSEACQGCPFPRGIPAEHHRLEVVELRCGHSHNGARTVRDYGFIGLMD